MDAKKVQEIFNSTVIKDIENDILLKQHLSGPILKLQSAHRLDLNFRLMMLMLTAEEAEP